MITKPIICHAITSLFVAFLLMLTSLLQAQSVQGVVLLDSLNLKVVKVFGTHQQRGYAYGYLLGQDIHQMVSGYIKPLFGNDYATAKALVAAGNDLQIDSRFLTEAQGIIDGMNAAGANPTGIDAYDLITGNCLLDVMALMGKKGDMGCSSLMSWGDATLGTPLNGKSVISRHLDWNTSSILVNNQVMVIHQPSEAGERPWLFIGFAGLMSPLSGVNSDLGAFQHVMDDYNSTAVHNMQFKPIWFAMRDALELDDYNNDGLENVNDLKASLLNSSNGFANGFIVSALARTSANDEEVAMVAELCPSAPFHTFRTNSFPDSIPGDNLYTANYQIGRNNALHFCSRYNNIRNYIGNGTLIGLLENWILMRDWSHLSHNIQFMQYCPENNLIQISMRSTAAAYLNDSLALNLDELLNQPVGIREIKGTGQFRVGPNPVSNTLIIGGLNNKNTFHLRIFDYTGRKVLERSVNPGGNNIELDVSQLKAGLYDLELSASEFKETLKFIKK